MKKKLLLMLLSLSMCGGFVSCNTNSQNDEEEKAYNIYSEKVDKFDLSTSLEGWTNSNWQYFLMSQDESGALNVNYNKSLDNAYGFAYTTLDGKFADFTYVNIKIKGISGETATIRVINDLEDSENNLLGSDVSLPLKEEYSSYTLKVKDTYQCRLDLAKYFAIIPDIGRQDDTTETMTIESVSFSKEVPEGYEWLNTGVDTGSGDSISVNGWTTYAWTGYSLLPAGNEVTLTYQTAPGSTIEGCADYAYMEKEINVNEGDNVLEFKWTNDKFGTNNSTTRISFILRGDVEEYVTPSPDNDVEYAYYKYYEEYVYNYRFGEEGEAVADEDGVITLNIPIGQALERLKGKHEDGLRLTLLVESNPNEIGEDYMNYDGFGVMTVVSFRTLKNQEVKETTWSTPSWCNYSISFDSSKNETTITTPSKVTDYSYCQSPIAYEENLNNLMFKFKNVDNSVTNIKFMLRGDVSEHVDVGPGVEYAYDLYFEKEIYTYDFYKENEVSADEEGNITLNIDVTEAINYLKDHIEGGLRLVLFIETDPLKQSEEHPFDGLGTIKIISCEAEAK